LDCSTIYLKIEPSTPRWWGVTKLVSSTILSGERKQQESKQAALEPVSQFSTAHFIERLESEDPNLRVALPWCEARQNAVETGLRLAGTLS